MGGAGHSIGGTRLPTGPPTNPSASDSSDAIIVPKRRMLCDRPKEWTIPLCAFFRGDIQSTNSPQIVCQRKTVGRASSVEGGHSGYVVILQVLQRTLGLVVK